MRDLFKVKEVFLSNGDSIKVTVFGQGEESMAIIPGMSLNPIWPTPGATVKRFSNYFDRYTFYLVDRKDNLQKGYSIEMMAADTKEALNLLGVESAYVYGASQGGMITMQMAIMYPDFVKAIVVASSSSKIYDFTIPIWQRWKDLCEAEDVPGIAKDTFEKIYSESFRQKYGRAYERLSTVFTKDCCTRFGILNDANENLNIDIEKIKCPSYVIGASKDLVFGDIPSKDIARIVGCECYIYPDGSHAIYDEEPDFVDRVIKFFESINDD